MFPCLNIIIDFKRFCNSCAFGCVIVQAVDRRSLTPRVRIQFQTIPCGICGVPSGTGTEFIRQRKRIPSLMCVLLS
jgi:hypothetical protein